MFEARFLIVVLQEACDAKATGRQGDLIVCTFEDCGNGMRAMKTRQI
jgi:hypothetical protein